MKKVMALFGLVLVLLLGVLLIFYPDISAWYNGRIHTGLLQAYNEEIAQMERAEIARQFERARAYNDALGGMQIEDPFMVGSGAVLPTADYMETLQVGGMMAQIEIPVIGVNLPVFHTTSAQVLERGVGHIEGTSFPIGGMGTHAVLTGHSGLVSATMFNDLVDLVAGDLFFVHVLGETLAYQVDQLTVVLPHEVETLRIAQDADFVTLITCVPYAINTHRLLVRGFRVPYTPEMIAEIVPRGRMMDWRVALLLVLAVFVFVMLIVFRLRERRRRAREVTWAR